MQLREFTHYPCNFIWPQEQIRTKIVHKNLSQACNKNRKSKNIQKKIQRLLIVEI